MEIKLRRKGEVMKVDGVDVPKILIAADGLEGVDLTGYSVIYARFGRRGHERAKELHGQAPSTIVVYQYEWRNGYGDGVLLPVNFDPSRVKFYKTSRQEEEEKKKTDGEAMLKLIKEVEAEIPKVRVTLNWDRNGVFVNPAQEAFANRWMVRASTLEEAKAGVEKMRPVWEEWNARALEAYMRHSGRPNPGNGNIQIFPSPNLRREKVGVCYDFNSDKWVVFEQKDGVWVETGTTTGSVSSY